MDRKDVKQRFAVLSQRIDSVRVKIAVAESQLKDLENSIESRLASAKELASKVEFVFDLALSDFDNLQRFRDFLSVKIADELPVLEKRLSDLELSLQEFNIDRDSNKKKGIDNG